MINSIGILGGMGPEASMRWYQMIIRMMQSKYHITQDNQMPEIYLFNLKLEGWSERGIEDEEAVKYQMMIAVKKMNHLAPDVIVMACNTIHKYLPYLKQQTNIPIWNMIGLCKDKASASGFQKLGILCSDTTNKEKLYGRDAIYCNEKEQSEMDKIILHCQGGNITIDDKLNAIEICHKLLHRGADAIIIGCTELPIILNPSMLSIPTFDAEYILLDKLTDEI